MPQLTMEIISLITIGVLLGAALFYCVLLVMADRRELNTVFLLSMIFLAFIIGFNDTFGPLKQLWPGTYRYDRLKPWLFLAANGFIMSVIYTFVQMPKFRQWNVIIINSMTAIEMVVCIFFFIADKSYYMMLIAIVSGLHFLIMSYVLYCMIKSVQKHIIDTIFIPILYIMFMILNVIILIKCFIDMPQVFKFFMMGGIFPVVLSIINITRKYTSLIKWQRTESTVAPDIDKRLEELEDANSSKDKFFSIIAHDLKSPISSIKTISELYYNEAISSNKTRELDLAKALRDSVDGLCELLNDLLSWSRSKLGVIEFKPGYIQIQTLADDIRHILHPISTAKNIEIKVNIKGGREQIYGDPKMLRTILRNLVSNAIKYSYRDSMVSVDFDTEGLYSIIRIADNGIGMNENELSDLFQLDKIYSKPGTNREVGNGLGLIVCNEFVRKHDGVIRVETEEDLGTTIIVKIPYMKFSNMPDEKIKAGNDITSRPAQKNEK